MAESKKRNPELTEFRSFWFQSNNPCLRRRNHLLGLLRVFLVEPLDSTCRVHKFLLTRKERVALRADFTLEITDRRSSLERVPANAGNRCMFVLRMNAVFHQESPILQ